MKKIQIQNLNKYELLQCTFLRLLVLNATSRVVRGLSAHAHYQGGGKLYCDTQDMQWRLNYPNFKFLTHAWQVIQPNVRGAALKTSASCGVRWPACGTGGWRIRASCTFPHKCRECKIADPSGLGTSVEVKVVRHTIIETWSEEIHNRIIMHQENPINWHAKYEQQNCPDTRDEFSCGTPWQELSRHPGWLLYL